MENGTKHRGQNVLGQNVSGVKCPGATLNRFLIARLMTVKYTMRKLNHVTRPLDKSSGRNVTKPMMLVAQNVFTLISVYVSNVDFELKGFGADVLGCYLLS